MGLLQGDRRRQVPLRVVRTYSEQAAEDIRVLLRRHGITNRELSQACHRSESWVGKRINGQIPIDLDDLEVLARALGVEPGELLPTGWVAPSPDPGTDGDAVWAPRGSNPQPADYKVDGSRDPVTHGSDIAVIRPLLPRRRCAVPYEPRKAA
jgi:transcriptional regulator with XRE-family HTH domain